MISGLNGKNILKRKIISGEDRNFALESYGSESKCFDHTETMWEERSCSQVRNIWDVKKFALDWHGHLNKHGRDILWKKVKVTRIIYLFELRLDFVLF